MNKILLATFIFHAHGSLYFCRACKPWCVMPLKEFLVTRVKVTVLKFALWFVIGSGFQSPPTDLIYLGFHQLQ